MNVYCVSDMTDTEMILCGKGKQLNNGYVYYNE